MKDIINKSKLEVLIKLFKPKKVPAIKISGIPPEVSNYMRDFGGHDWLSAPISAYEKNTDAFILMDNHVLKHFIAGYIKTIIEGSLSCVEEEFVGYVGSDHFIMFTDHLSYAQVKYIFEFVINVCENESFYRIVQEKVLNNYIKYEEKQTPKLDCV